MLLATASCSAVLEKPNKRNIDVRITLEKKHFLWLCKINILVLKGKNHSIIKHLYKCLAKVDLNVKCMNIILYVI